MNKLEISTGTITEGTRDASQLHHHRRITNAPQHLMGHADQKLVTTNDVYVI